MEPSLAAIRRPLISPFACARAGTLQTEWLRYLTPAIYDWAPYPKLKGILVSTRALASYKANRDPIFGPPRTPHSCYAWLDCPGPKALAIKTLSQLANATDFFRQHPGRGKHTSPQYPWPKDALGKRGPQHARGGGQNEPVSPKNVVIYGLDGDAIVVQGPLLGVHGERDPSSFLPSFRVM